MPSARAVRGGGQTRPSPRRRPGTSRTAASRPKADEGARAASGSKVSRDAAGGDVRQPVPFKLTHACVITPDVEGMRNFYSVVLHMPPAVARPDYVEFAAGGAALSLYDQREFARYAPPVESSGACSRVMIEFVVDNVDREYARLRRFPIDWVKPPSTQPWGNRSLYLRDPDGNLVNLYSRVDVSARSSDDSDGLEHDTSSARRRASART